MFEGSFSVYDDVPTNNSQRKCIMMELYLLITVKEIKANLHSFSKSMVQIIIRQNIVFVVFIR